MKNQESKFNLLDGTFTGTETREILVALFRDKINFHSLKSLSHEERFGKPDLHAQERIAALKRILEGILSFLDQNADGNRFEIHADIKIRTVDLISYRLHV
jgi:hypothetical protein